MAAYTDDGGDYEWFPTVDEWYENASPEEQDVFDAMVRGELTALEAAVRVHILSAH